MIIIGLKPEMMYWLDIMVVKPMIFVTLVWWPKLKQAIAVNKLCTVYCSDCIRLSLNDMLLHMRIRTVKNESSCFSTPVCEF